MIFTRPSFIPRINLHLPPYSLSLFSTVFVLTIAFQFLDSTSPVLKDKSLTATFNSSMTNALPEKKHISMSVASAQENENAIYSGEKAETKEQESYKRAEFVSIPSSDSDEEKSLQKTANLNRGDDLPAYRQQRIYLPGVTGGNISSTLSNDSASSFFSPNTRQINNSTAPTNVSQSEESNSAPQQPLSSQQIEENLIAENQVNTRAEELYEQRRQNVCNGVIARVGANPIASDFNSVGEYYRLRDGYRCF